MPKPARSPSTWGEPSKTTPYPLAPRLDPLRNDLFKGRRRHRALIAAYQPSLLRYINAAVARNAY
jgi:hypothetical protein